MAGNSVTWTALKVSTGQWTVTSTTHSPNGKATRVLQEQLQSKQVPGSPSTFWGYGFVMGGQSTPGGFNPNQICENGRGPDKPTVFGGSGTVNVPVWIAGDVCTSGGNSPIRNPTTGAPITVHIGGFIYGSNGPSYIVGAPGNNVANFEAIGGCYDKHTNSGQLPLACDTGGDATQRRRQLGHLLERLRREHAGRQPADTHRGAGADAVQHCLARADSALHCGPLGRDVPGELLRQRGPARSLIRAWARAT